MFKNPKSPRPDSCATLNFDKEDTSVSLLLTIIRENLFCIVKNHFDYNFEKD